MKILLNELKKFINLDKISINKLIESLNSLAYEVEYYQRINNLKSKSFIKLAKVISCKKHPHADKLSLCKLETDNKEYQVICGAKNIKEGQTVIHALPGAIINDHKLEVKKIRNVLSYGMVLSIEELLNLNEEIIDDQEKDNILVLDNRISLKNNLFDLLKIDDYLIEIAILPDRIYANSYQFLAKELAAFLDLNLLDQEENNIKFNPEINLDLKESDLNLTDDAVALAVANATLNTNSKIKTPFEIKLLLYLNNIKPKNNILDLIYYFRLIYGLTIYEVDKNEKYQFNGQIINNKIDIFNKYFSKNKINETQEISFIAIASTKKENVVGIDDDKLDFIARQNIKGTEFSQINLLKHFLYYGKKYDYLKSYSNIISKNKIANDFTNEIKTIKLEEEFLKNYIGEKINLHNVLEKLKIIGFNYIKEKELWKIPNYRFNLDHKQDMIEEIMRYYKLENIQAKKYPITKEFIKIEKNKYFIEKVSELLISYGFSEARNYSFVNKNEFMEYNLWNIKKPIFLNQKYNLKNNILRNSLLKGLLNSHSLNYKHNFEDIRLFEFANIYFSDQEDDFKLTLGLIFDDKITYKFEQEIENQEYSPLLVGNKIIKEILNILGLKTEKYLTYKEIKTKEDIFNKTQAVEVYYNNKLIAYFGELSPKILRAKKYIRIDKIKAHLYYLEMI